MASKPISVSEGVDKQPTTPARLMSMDALRGFDMFWIVGAESLVAALHKLNKNEVVGQLAEQLEHVKWAGFHFEDLIFPMFVFIVGVSLVFSLTKTIEQHGRGAVVRRILQRAVLLYLLGIFYYGGFSTPFQRIRLLGVLQRIAIAYLVSALLFCFVGLRGCVVACVGLLLGYWALMLFVPVPGVGAGHFEPGQNLANWVDQEYLPLRKWEGNYDPEGLLSTLPAIANCLFGVFAGCLLQSTRRNDAKVFFLVVSGVVSASLGWLWGFEFPVIKQLWTSSFVLMAVGYSSILLGLFYLVIDVWQVRGWAQPFVWIGMNPITIYMIYKLVDIRGIALRFVGGDLKKYYLGDYGDLAVALVEMAIIFAIGWFLYRRKIFLRL